MCAIYGIVSLSSGRTPGEEMLFRMGNVVTHRGPDDYGHYCGDGIALGMRRLSIIDVAGGHQPIGNEDGTVWVVCNGEVYNFEELRDGLEARGHRFRSDSDTEVIVHLYEEQGTEVFKQLRGMFSIAIWDSVHSRLILARDRLGQKPLYVLRESHRLLFGSEVKSILGAATESPRLNVDALPEYLALGYVPAPKTLFYGIDKVLPGHYMVVEGGSTKVKQYWDVPGGPVQIRSESEWIESVREKLLEAIRLHLVSDVPVGAFLSGGIDSGTIVAAMSGMSDRPVKTYSIGFDSENAFYNELPYAGIVARAFGTDHHEIVVRPQVADLLPKLMWHLEEPLADSAFVTTFLVANLAKEDVTVILSGVGGDELFGGYRRYLGDALAGYYQWVPDAIRKKWLPNLVSQFSQDRHSRFTNYARYADAFLRSAESDAVCRYLSYVTLFSQDMQETLLSKEVLDRRTLDKGFPSATMKTSFERNPELGTLNRLSYVDLKTSLPDDLLALTDKMTMAASIECRAPFVDHELVELAARIPDSLKIRGFTLKYLLKKVVKPWLPEEIVKRTKRGFGAPMGSWIRHELEPLVDTLLSESQVEKRGLLNWSYVRDLVTEHKARRRDYTDHLLALINLELWCQMFLDERSRQTVADMRGIGAKVQ